MYLYSKNNIDSNHPNHNLNPSPQSSELLTDLKEGIGRSEPMGLSIVFQALVSGPRGSHTSCKI